MWEWYYTTMADVTSAEIEAAISRILLNGETWEMGDIKSHLGLDKVLALRQQKMVESSGNSSNMFRVVQFQNPTSGAGWGTHWKDLRKHGERGVIHILMPKRQRPKCSKSSVTWKWGTEPPALNPPKAVGSIVIGSHHLNPSTRFYSVSWQSYAIAQDGSKWMSRMQFPQWTHFCRIV